MGSSESPSRSELMQLARLVHEARLRRAEARRKVLAARVSLDDAQAEYVELDTALSTLDRLRREHEDFARDALGDE
jgi:hypothetical protein